MIQVPKKSGKIRICVDLRWLNKAVKRECYVMPTLDDIAPKLAGSMAFSSLDASSGCRQIPLDHESRKYTIFITPSGRFCFRQLPIGIPQSLEIFQ